MWHDQGQGNESGADVWDYQFWVTGLKMWQILMFYTVLDVKELFKSLQDWDGVQIKMFYLNRQVIYFGKSQLNIANMWLIPLDCVTYVMQHIKGGGELCGLWKLHVFHFITMIMVNVSHVLCCLQVLSIDSWHKPNST